MCGRATLVWEVCTLSEFRAKNLNAKILVLKQSWQRLPGEIHTNPDFETTPFEEFVYKQAKMTMGRFQKGMYVHDRMEVIVSTKNSIRRNVVTEVVPLRRIGPKKQNTPNKRHETKTKSASNWLSGMTDVEAQTLIWKSQNPTAFADRRLTRILMQRRGEPLGRFKDLVEFVEALLDAVKTHERLYNAGILHRDISPNNIIICHSSQRVGDEVGDLIDYDHAKITKSFKMWEEMQDWSDTMDSNAKVPMMHAILKASKAPLTLSAVKKVLKVVQHDDVPSYFLKIFGRFPSRCPVEPENEMELEDLHLKEPVSPQPFFSVEVGRGERTGTPAYMSHKLLVDTQVIHDAIHDMESFFWIIVEYALTRDGPGDLECSLTEELAGLLYEYFDSGVGTKKAGLFPSSTTTYSAAFRKLDDELISRFHPYFRPIENLVKEWWKTLFTALECRAFEMANIHFYIKSILTKALRELHDNPPPPHRFTVKEERRRQRLDNAIKIAIKEQRMILPGDLEEEEEPMALG